ncbi:MAG TPA: sigma-70 family RNA polymerase sigma factor [Steroidobacteraceae bacterium]|nr:sigma-70 family RNA polymerase sigma factor [Steroidobacteraceae bacterium]
MPLLSFPDAAMSADNIEPNIAALAHQYGPLVYRAAYKLLDNHSAAQDIQQDIFVRLLERPPQHVQSWPAYLTSCATRLSIDQLRRQRRWRSFLPFLGDTENTAESADQHVSNQQDVNRLRKGLARLNSREATCFAMRFIHGATIADIAHATGLTANHVSVSLHRATVQLEKFCGDSAARGE